MTETVFDWPGLSAPGSILIDRWGVPHIRAANEHDLFYLQGLNAARDRLWQIDLWRKRGLGLLSADFGPGYLEQDRATRLFLYRGDMAAEWAAYARDAEAICTAFTDGINAWIDHLEATGAELPPEFRRLGTRPAKWAPADVVRIRSHSMMRNGLSEIIRANVMAGAPEGADLLRQWLQPARDVPVPEGLDLGDVPLDCLDLFKLAIVPVSFEPARLDATLAEAHLWRRIAPTGEVMREAANQGSNNWVIAPHRTETGRPILASDPHRAHAVPSLRYVVHLSCPGLDLIGAGEPCLPGICIGHNGTAAMGLTLFFGPDQEDVHVYETAPDDPLRYRYGGGWEAMQVLREAVPLAGGGSATVELAFTRHGPVIWHDREKGRAVAIRTVWTDPGTAPYFRSIASMRATSFGQYRALVAGWGVPAVNLVYADISGDIGWTTAGFSPVRPNWDGLLPVPGDGRYEWAGYFPAERLPFCLNPEAGHFATANEMNLPAGWDQRIDQIGFEWIEPSRANRIAEVLGAQGMQTLAGSEALQCDVLSIPARRLLAVLARADLSGPAAAVARRFEGWDFRLDSDSAPAALFEIWWMRHLRPGVIAAVVADPALRAVMLPGDPGGILEMLEAPDARLGPDPLVVRDRLLSDTLVAAAADAAALTGAAPAGWGQLHRGRFVNPTDRVADGIAIPAVPEVAVPGSESTVMNNAYRGSDFTVTLGASVRLVIDVGQWDNSRFVNAPGQSGDPRSPFYADLAGPWAEGQYFPLLYSAAAVEAATIERLEFRPA